MSVAEPAARVEATGSALPVPFDLSYDPLRAYIGDYSRISMQDGIAETLGAFRALLDAGKVDADSIA